MAAKKPRKSSKPRRTRSTAESTSASPRTGFWWGVTPDRRIVEADDSEAQLWIKPTVLVSWELTRIDGAKQCSVSVGYSEVAGDFYASTRV